MSEEPQMKSAFIDAPAGRIHYLEAGKGAPVILLHGGGPGAYGLSNYVRNVDSLVESGRRVIVMDLPGFGESAFRPSSEGMFVPHAQATLELMDHLKIKKASIVGNSLGGGTALRIALDQGERVDKLILMGCGGGFSPTTPTPTEGLQRVLDFYKDGTPSIDKLRRIFEQFVYDASVLTPGLIEGRYERAVLPHILANPPLHAIHHVNNELWRERLDTLPHKTLLIWGEVDRVVPLDSALILLKLIPNADLHVFSKSGHWAQWERAQDFNRVVIAFLNS